MYRVWASERSMGVGSKVMAVSPRVSARTESGFGVQVVAAIVRGRICIRSMERLLYRYSEAFRIVYQNPRSSSPKSAMSPLMSSPAKMSSSALGCPSPASRSTV